MTSTVLQLTNSTHPQWVGSKSEAAATPIARTTKSITRHRPADVDMIWTATLTGARTAGLSRALLSTMAFLATTTRVYDHSHTVKTWAKENSATDPWNSLFVSALFAQDSEGILRTFHNASAKSSGNTPRQLLYFAEAKRMMGEAAESYRASGGEAVIELAKSTGRTVCVIGQEYFNVMTYTESPEPRTYQRFVERDEFTLGNLFDALDKALTVLG